MLRLSTHLAIPELKRMCRLYRCNLCDGPMLLEKYDGILLRNVMLYFSIEKRRQLLLEMHFMLHPDGFLLLWSSEQQGSTRSFPGGAGGEYLLLQATSIN